MWALIRVHQDYDLVEKLELVGKFDNEELAESYRQEIMLKAKTSVLTYIEYIKNYIDNFHVPAPNSYNEWYDYCVKWLGKGIGIYDKERFIMNLRWRLNGHNKIPDENFRPPAFTPIETNLFILEI